MQPYNPRRPQAKRREGISLTTVSIVAAGAFVVTALIAKPYVEEWAKNEVGYHQTNDPFRSYENDPQPAPDAPANP